MKQRLRNDFNERCAERNLPGTAGVSRAIPVERLNVAGTDLSFRKLMEVDLSKIDSELTYSEKAPARAWLMGIAAWLVPGLGHLLQGKWVRALLLGSAVWVCFVSGFLMGGYLFRFDGSQQGLASLLQIPPMIGNLGAGLLYIVCWVLGFGFSYQPHQAALPTFEYGWTFLLVAGLLNYLATLDAFDIAAGRKS